MRPADPPVTVFYVSDYPAQRPPRAPARAFVGRPWLATAVLAACTTLAALAMTAARISVRGPQLPVAVVGQRLPLAVLACCLIVFLRRWPPPALPGTAAAAGVGVASGTAPPPFRLPLGGGGDPRPGGGGRAAHGWAPGGGQCRARMDRDDRPARPGRAGGGAGAAARRAGGSGRAGRRDPVRSIAGARP